MRNVDRNPRRSTEPVAGQPSGLSTSELEGGLADLGLSEREARLYAAMLSKPDSTSIELQRVANVPRTKIYEILARMIERKLCIERQVGRTKRYTPVDPKVLVAWRKQQMAAQLSQIEKLESNMSRLYEGRDRSPVPLEYLEVLRTRQQIGQRIDYLLDKCHTELLAFSKAPFSVQFEDGDEETLRSLKRIKDVRSIYEFELIFHPNWKVLKQYIMRWHDAGEKSRFIHKLPTKLLVFDGLHVLLLIQDAIGPGQEAPVLFSNRELALAFRTLFEYVWEEAVPYEQFIVRHDEIVAERSLRQA